MKPARPLRNHFCVHDLYTDLTDGQAIDFDPKKPDPKKPAAIGFRLLWGDVCPDDFFLHALAPGKMGILGHAWMESRFKSAYLPGDYRLKMTKAISRTQATTSKP